MYSAATGSNVIWDVVETEVAGESRGLVLGVENIVKGKSDVGEIFYVVAEQGMVVAGGALGVKGVSKGVPKLKKGRVKNTSTKRCKRNVEEFQLIDYQLPDLPEFAREALPGSVKDLQSVRWNDVDQSIAAIASIFLILKLFLVGHPASNNYLEEICTAVHPGTDLQQCEKQLVLAIQKYQDIEAQPEDASPFEDSLRSLVFEMNQMMSDSVIGEGLVNSICNSHYPTKVSLHGRKGQLTFVE